MQENFVINSDGSITTIYSDDLAELCASQRIERASNVEADGLGKWYVQLSDSKLNGKFAGKIIGSGFTSRAEALKFEVQWLVENILNPQEKKGN